MASLPHGAAGRSLEERLPNLVEQLAAVADLDGTALRYGALIRRRGVSSAEVLLKLAFLYGLGGYSFRTTAALAHSLGIVSLTDTAILERLRRLAPWLEHLLAGLLERRALPPPPGGARARPHHRRWHQPVPAGQHRHRLAAAPALRSGGRATRGGSHR